MFELFGAGHRFLSEHGVRAIARTNEEIAEFNFLAGEIERPREELFEHSYFGSAVIAKTITKSATVSITPRTMM
jgi:hypothetical protein